MSMVDLAFPIVQGSVVPLDHAHLLLGALKGAIPQLAEIRLGVHPLTGDVFPASGLLNLDRRAVLRLRLDDAFIPLAAPLAGRELRIGSMLIRLGRPTVEMLAPRSALHAAMVVVARTVPRAMRGIRPDGRSDRVNRVCTGPELVTYIQSRCNPGAGGFCREPSPSPRCDSPHSRACCGRRRRNRWWETRRAVRRGR